MTHDEFIKIFDDDEMAGSLLTDLEGDNALIGLNLINRYMPGEIILCGADHDIIYSVTIEDLIKAGIKRESVEYLSKINWSIQDDYLICFV